MPEEPKSPRRAVGLEEKDAAKRLQEYGPNEIRELDRISPAKILLRQVESNLIVYLLSAAAVISFAIDDALTGLVIIVILIVIILAGFVQEYRAEKAIKALKKLVTPVSVVIRDGKEREMPSARIVPEDVILLRSGEKVPADCIVIDETELRVDESILTGESNEKRKEPAKDLRSYRRENTLFMGTFVVEGVCTARVIHTGMNTEFGKIAGMISEAKKESPLQLKVNRLTKYMAVIAIAASALTGFMIIARSPHVTEAVFLQAVIAAIALSVSAFPEGFPVVLISTLAAGAYRMARKNAIVNRMSILETLGEATVICADKTGTITRGEMTVRKIFAGSRMIDVGTRKEVAFSYEGKGFEASSDLELGALMKAAVICNDSVIEEIEGAERRVIGSQTEASLLVMAAKAGVFKESFQSTRIAEIPFSSRRKLMSVLSREPEGNYVYVKGAPEFVMPKCMYIRSGGRQTELGKDEAARILAINGKLAASGFRMLALASKKLGNEEQLSENDLLFLGFVGIEDPPREEVKDALRICEHAGIGVKMITGDERGTAMEIARQIGLPGKSLDGADLDKLTDEELAAEVRETAIFSRAMPEHKLRIVKALKANNEIVAMTGDGVNDAPALKEAHIGIAMGINGTDVSRESSDLILKDDNFFTIVSAISEGRAVFSNIRKFLTYQLSCNYAEIATIFSAVAVGLPLPLIALQVLFMNLVTDDLPALTLGFTPASSDIMKAKPRKGSDLLDRNLMILLAITGTIMALGTVGVFYAVLDFMHGGIEVARTTTLVTLIFFEIANAFSFRSFRLGVHESPFFLNKYLVYASAASIAATAFVIYGPLAHAFQVVPIGIGYLSLSLLVSLTVVLAYDIIKTESRRRGWRFSEHD